MISAEFRLGPQVHNFPQAILNVHIIIDRQRWHSDQRGQSSLYCSLCLDFQQSLGDYLAMQLPQHNCSDQSFH